MSHVLDSILVSTDLEFIPAAVSVGGRLVPDSLFQPVVTGRITAASAASEVGLVVVIDGFSYRCLWVALGGKDSNYARHLIDAVRLARLSGHTITLFGAPGKSGKVLGGYFCAITSA